MTRQLYEMISEQKLGKPRGIYSVCSAHPMVLEAAFSQALEDSSAVLIESTSNQVDQFGGYTGMTPEGFAGFVHSIASKINFPSDKIILGGDHLGPNVWSKEPSASAMAKARRLVEAYISAGYRKIHLDCSMHCADDRKDEALSDQTVAKRAAELCLVCEATYQKNPMGPEPVYVIGTEVPVPGGAKADEGKLHITSVEDLSRTLEITKQIFELHGLGRVWKRVIAVVVQPGVEFGDSEIIPYERAKAAALSGFIGQYENLIYEAHSTDYQTPLALRQMVEDHFGILKVGPWLTFAMREAIFALSHIENELLSSRKGYNCSGIPAILEKAMLENPRYWQSHYSGNEPDLLFARKYSFSDRSRYYWVNPPIAEALNLLLHNLTENIIPLTLISQYLPGQYSAVRDGHISPNPIEIIRHKIKEVLNIYSIAGRTKQYAGGELLKI